MLPTVQNVWDRWLFNLTNFKLGVLVILVSFDVYLSHHEYK